MITPWHSLCISFSVALRVNNGSLGLQPPGVTSMAVTHEKGHKPSSQLAELHFAALQPKQPVCMMRYCSELATHSFDSYCAQNDNRVCNCYMHHTLTSSMTVCQWHFIATMRSC